MGVMSAMFVKPICAMRGTKFDMTPSENSSMTPSGKMMRQTFFVLRNCFGCQMDVLR